MWCPWTTVYVSTPRCLGYFHTLFFSQYNGFYLLLWASSVSGSYCQCGWSIGVSGFVTNCLCVLSWRGLTTCSLYDGPFLEKLSISYLIHCYKGCLLVSFSPPKYVSSWSTVSKDIIRANPNLHLIYISALFLHVIWALFISFKRWINYPTMVHEESTYAIRSITPVQTTPTCGHFVFIALSGRLLFVPTATERLCRYA